MAKQSQQPNLIFGRVTDAQNRALANLLVYAYDRDMRSEDLLGETITDRDGKYEIQWAADQPDTKGKRTADLVIKVITRERKTQLFASDMDNMRFNAGPREEINIVIRQAIQPEVVEYDYIMQEISTLIDKVPVKDLQENDQYRDITFLSKEAEIAFEKIEHLVVAHRLQAASDIDPAFFYALLRKNTLLKNDLSKAIRVRLRIGFETDILPLLYDAALTDPKVIQADVSAAKIEMIVSENTAKQAKKQIDLLQRFLSAGEAYYLNEYPEKVLDTIGHFVQQDKIGEMARIFQENKNDLDAFFKKISSADFFKSDDSALDAKLTVALSEWFGFDAHIIDKVKNDKKLKKPEDIRKLATLNKAEWKALLTKSAAAPDQSLGKTLDKKLIDLHASSLARKMEKEFPTVAFAAQLGREKGAVLQNQSEIKAFFEKHEDFDLQHSNIDLFLKNKKMATPQHEAMWAELKSVQRVFKLVPHYGKTNALMQQKIHSAQSIAAMGERRFIREIAPTAGISKTEARQIFQRAERTNTAAMLIVGELQDTIRTMNVAAMETSTLSLKLTKVAADFPNLKTLFKLTDVCACEHCRSVYSPAAYLVEILQFLDKRSVLNASNLSAKEELFLRRPDLGDIDLGCENANTPVPYIDLVCELMEAEVAPDQGIAFTGVLSDGADPLAGIISNDLWMALKNQMPVTTDAQIFKTEVKPGWPTTFPHYLRDKKVVCKIIETFPGHYLVFRLRQTLSSAEELAAAPEYLNETAYTELNSVAYAFKLPFDLYHTEVNVYFDRFGLDRADLMQDFQVTSVPANRAIAAQRMGLTDNERHLIVTSIPNLLYQQLIWNAPNGETTLLDFMKRMDHFLDKTGLTFKEANLLLSLKFIDPTSNLFIRNNDLSCDTAQKEIPNLDVAALDRIYRFLFWQKRTGWKFETLQEIIYQSNLGATLLNDACLIHAANLARLSQKTGITVDELIGFYHEIPYSEYASSEAKPLYHKAFLNKARNGFIDPMLLPENFTGTDLLDTVKTSLSVCLQVSEPELAKLIAILAPSTVIFDNLSYLFAATRLMRKLKLKADDFIALRQLSTIDFQKSPADTLAFVEVAEASKALPLKLSEVKFMLWHKGSNSADLEIKPEKIEAVLSKLQSEFQKAFESTKSNFNSSLSADEQKENLRTQLSKLEGVSEEDVKKILGFVDKIWDSLADAQAFLTNKLGTFFDVAQANNSLMHLNAVPPGADFSNESKVFVKSLMAGMADFNFKTAQNAAIEQSIAVAFKADLELVKTILKYAKLKKPAPGTDLIRDTLYGLVTVDVANNVLISPPVLNSNFQKPFRSMRLLHKMLPFLQSFKLDIAAVEWYFQHNANPILNWFLWDEIPNQAGQTRADFYAFLAFAQLVARSKNLTPVQNPANAENPVSFFSLADLILSNTVSRSNFLENFALLTGFEKSEVLSVDAYLFPSSTWNVNIYNDPKNWQKVETCLTHLRTLGSTVAQVKDFIKPLLTNAEVQVLRAALKSRYDEDTWLGTLKEITDAIRPQKRDALVAYLLAKNSDFKSENDLYDHFLVDVEMEACMPSSRIVQAHGTVQLFVQRCLMGLEPGAVADVETDNGWEQWKWMKNYRVWEANRKVFLYPENWIEAELRDDKSFLFSELENEIQQNELTNFTAEEALIKYLEKLDGLAFLEVVATWYESEIKTMHVFGRTKGGDPDIYYYRRFEQERYWTPWEKVELDITGTPLALVRNHRLTLVWPVFSEEPDAKQKAKVPSEGDQGKELDSEKPNRRLKIQLAMSEFANQKWQPKKISKEGILTPDAFPTPIDSSFVDHPKLEEMLQRDKYNLMYLEAAEQVWLFYTDIPLGEEEHTVSGIFNLTGCKGYPELYLQELPALPDFLPDFKDTRLSSQRYHERDSDLEDDLAVRNGVLYLGYTEILHATPGTFRLSYPHQFTMIDFVSFLYDLLSYVGSNGGNAPTNITSPHKFPLGTLLPYFMEDSNHAYVIIPGFYGYKRLSGTQNRVTFVKKPASDVMQMIENVQRWIAAQDYQKIIEARQEFDGLLYGEQFKNLYHPLVCSLRTTLYRDGIPALMKRETQFRQTPFNFQNHYEPSQNVPAPYPIEDVDFASDGSYSLYNWELFFHVPFLMATRLTKEQRFEEAMTWFHYIFDPTGALTWTPDGTNSAVSPQKYWVTKPFFNYEDADYTSQRINDLLYSLSDPATDPQIKADLEFAISQWRIKPFRPHVVARFRPVAYQKAVLMKYVDNLMEWGDYLFRQDTMESIVQATQMYILADKLLGEKPRTIPPLVKPPYETYNQMEQKLDAFGNAMIDLENLLPDLSALPEHGAELPAPMVTLSMLYFCIPQNDKMLEYWDRVADRLFKIRHCQNIDGVERSLALFAPPIDPGMLVRAAASGLDISSVLAGINAPTPYYRFNVLSQKATELVNEVRGLGSSLLQVLEKKDAEAMSLLRSELEIKVLNAVRDMKKLQIKESKEQIEVLKRTKKVTEERQNYYANIEKINSKEQLNLDKLEEAHGFQIASQVVRTIGGVLAMLPEVTAGVSGFGGSPEAKIRWGGANLSRAANAAADVLNIISSLASYEASRASILGGYQRRDDDWKFQERLANLELNSIEKQIAAAEIRKEIAETDLKNHDLQIENAKKTDDFMRTKYTNKELYEWMIGQISSVYFRSYQLAHDFAKKAERCYRFELGNDDTFISFGYWDSRKKGLQSADHLLHDLKRMETAYLDKNKREYEITKHVSLALLDPLALIKLRATGSCHFDIPEVLFDMDFAGQYFRRIKSVSISLPCIAGPYTSVSAKLSLVNNKYRKNVNPNSSANTGYPENPVSGDDRFIYNLGAIQTIAASNAQNDSGVFELNFRDERYLPFEGTGAISSWRLELPRKDLSQFNYDTIADVIVHLKYTAREGGSSLRGAAETALKDQLAAMKQQLNETGMHVAINLKHDMPNEWHLLHQNPPVGQSPSVDLKIDKSRLPYMAQLLDATIDSVMFVSKSSDNPASITVNIDADTTDANNTMSPLTLARIDAWQMCRGTNSAIALETPFKISIPPVQLAKLEALMLVVKYVFN